MIFLILSAGAGYAFDPMRIQVRTLLPEDIKTVGEAAQYYADAIGYKLITIYPAPEESRKISRAPISLLARKNTVMAVEDAIITLLDERYFLVIDHQHKLFSFKLGAD